MLSLLMGSMRSGVPRFDVLDSIDSGGASGGGGAATGTRDTGMVWLLITMAYRGGTGARDELASFIGPQLMDGRAKRVKKVREKRERGREGGERDYGP